MRFLYNYDIPQNRSIAATVIAALYTAGIQVTAMPGDKATYNARHCHYIADPVGWVCGSTALETTLMITPRTKTSRPSNPWTTMG